MIAHELAHVRARDVLTQTYAVLLSTTLLELSRVGGFLSRFLLAVLAPDRSGVHAPAALPEAGARAPTPSPRGIVDPHDLADALIRLDRAAELVEFHASPATEPLYTVSPFDHTERVPACSSRIRRSPSGSRGCGLPAIGGAARRGRRPALPAERPG